jgi:hypothetical protein
MSSAVRGPPGLRVIFFLADTTPERAAFHRAKVDGVTMETSMLMALPCCAPSLRRRECSRAVTELQQIRPSEERWHPHLGRL